MLSFSTTPFCDILSIAPLISEFKGFMRFTKTLSPQKTLDIRGQNCYSYLVPFDIKYAGMVKLANTLDSGSSVARLAGSSPVTRTKIGNPLMKIGGFLILYYSFFIIHHSLKRISVMNDEIASLMNKE